MATAEEVTVAGPPRVTPRLAGCRRLDCGLPGAVALVDSAPSSPPPLRPAGSSGPSTGLPSPNPEYSTWAPVRSAMLCPPPPVWHAGLRHETRAQHQDRNMCGSCRGAHRTYGCPRESTYIWCTTPQSLPRELKGPDLASEPSSA
ncbi:hypothetical protein LEMLEM_LOCUS7396 [Lemmus lemmus]